MTRIMIMPTIVTALIVIIPSVFATVNPDNLTTLDR
jgi:hypothetical protein